MNNTPSAAATSRLHLPVLDGVRGLAALYVALFHALGYTGYIDTLRTQTLSIPMALLAAVLDYGTYAVPVFIVLSGFCLMLPLAQRETLHIPGGVGSFLSRRAWRILPAYYAALLLNLALIALVPVLQTQQNTSWDNKVPVTIGAIVSHLLLVHNFNPEWLFKINGPMWSIAVEWQIYFLFPILLLPLWRRTNMVVTVIVALLIGVAPHFLLPDSLSIDHSNPWFLGLFAMGMAGATIALSTHPQATWLRTSIPWKWLTWALGLTLLAGLALMKNWMEWHPYISEPLVGVVVTGFLIQYATTTQAGRRPLWSQRFLETRPMLSLGAFSYSVYLIHDPILALFNFATLNTPMSADLRLGFMVGVAVPCAIFCSYLFYLLVERRFIRMRAGNISTRPTKTSSAMSNP
jgi:peptidoglycan/LPS O-acetylase OafA/YrhL